MQQPSVLFINRIYPPSRGPTGRLLRDLARSFVEEGWHVSVVTTGPKAGTERDGTITVHRVKGPDKPSLMGYPWIWLKLLIKARKAGHADLVVSMTDPPMLVLAGAQIAKAKKAKHLHWCQDYYPGALDALELHVPGFIRHYLDKASSKALQACDKIIVIGRCMAKNLAADGVPARKISVIPNWPDAELVNPPPEIKQFGEDKTAAGGNVALTSKPYQSQVKNGPKFRVLYAGNVGLAHPAETILDAAKILEEDHPEIEFVFVGDGRRIENLAREREKRGLGNIRFIPYQPAHKLREVMESGDVHLIVLRDSACGYMVPSKLYSALAVGRPVIYAGPEGSEIDHIITDFQAGTRTPPQDGAALAKAVLEYRQNGDTWFAAHDGALEAGKVLTPKESMKAWIKRALSTIQGREEKPAAKDKPKKKAA
ncbi:MAG: glycosyltransferase family 4 protein [Alphaproteobacteria bacterium]|nr:glycosyltransferase family 4 protein [Alphaproteobacteria bacterium]MCD8520426.1 glycosyltransferase family 4 protein [Alphaproteobacteria bacterium]